MHYNECDLNAYNLFVEGRIDQADAKRQEKTARAILERFNRQPGVILADEVGMGKTFVAMAVACSIAVKEKKPVVIMIPASLRNKWPGDFKLFCQYCVKDPILRRKLKAEIAERPEDFLKLLDNDEIDPVHIIFLTHGALSRKLSDGWVKLAILQRVLRGRHNTDDIYRSLARYTGALIEKQSIENKNKDVSIWSMLLNKSPKEWKRMLVKNKFVELPFDDPVPELFQQELSKLSTVELNHLYNKIVQDLPRKDSNRLRERLSELRTILSAESKKIWERCLRRIKLDLPLLIFDEAHHLKNSKTQLVRGLFEPLSVEDAGMLSNQFDRMLFLTATPFQLGHHELMNVLNRFCSVKWDTSHPPSITKDEYVAELKTLQRQLDDSQIAARRLDRSWSHLKPEDVHIDTQPVDGVYMWWKHVQQHRETRSQVVQRVIEDYEVAKEHLKNVQPSIGRYVIRHLKPRFLSNNVTLRRQLLTGKSITDDNSVNGPNAGLSITKDSLLPFLLAARLTTIRQNERPVFAEGLASSYEAFRYTREQRIKNAAKKNNNSDGNSLTDIDDDPQQELNEVTDPVSTWYLDQLDRSLQKVNDAAAHPKIRPTVEKAIDLWSKGEKVLIFCHYVETGKALRKYISEAMRNYNRRQGAQKFACDESEVEGRLKAMGEVFRNKNSSAYQLSANNISQLIDEYKDLVSYKEDIIASVMRFVSTPSFLVRFATTEVAIDHPEFANRSFESKDQSGFTLFQIIDNFLAFLDNRIEDREQYIQYLKLARTDEVMATSLHLLADDGAQEEQEAQKDHILASVRFCYGQTSPDIRQKLMKTFNTPFFPDILITSSVMAEGVDLHLNCRFIIHHDLCWNPSTLEQRTGRVDRIGAKAEKAGMPIQVYLPYVSETQDEKMYRVVMERERWFNIIMGEKYKVDVVNTDKYAERVPLPEELAKELSFDLSVK